MPAYSVGICVVKIYDAYKVRKWNMCEVLRRIERDPDTQTLVFFRSRFSLKMEWICHNFLYRIGYKRPQTKDADLDYPADHPEWLYCICGLLVWIFVW